MAKKRQAAAQTTDYSVRNFPVDLLEKMRRIKSLTGTPVYVQIRNAVREKLEREKENK